MNIPEFIKEKADEKALNFIMKNKLPIPDQDALNEVAKDKIVIFDISWNCFFDLYLKNDLYLKWNSDLVKIIHYTTPKKPWKYLFYKHKYFDIYNEYWNKSYLKIFKIKYIMISCKNLAISFFNETIKRKILDFKYKNI